MRPALLLTLVTVLCGNVDAQTNLGFISFTNKTGHFIERAEVYKLAGERVFYRLTTGAGGGSVLLADLPDNIQSRFGYGTTATASAQHRLELVQDAIATTNVVELKFTTSPTIKPIPFWTPTAAQLTCGTIYFSTKVNEFDRVIEHYVFNIDDDALCTIISRRYNPATPLLSTYEFLALSCSKRRQTFIFDPAKPIEFIIDGVRFSFTDQRALVLQTKYDVKLKEYTQSLTTYVDESFVRSLANAERASVRVHTDTKPQDHDFTFLELRRVRLFAQNFLPLAIK